jgi:alpha-beta hydrolase superfamily lysophospholipase
MSPVPAPSSNPPSDQGRLEASDGIPLSWYRWDPTGPVRGTVCLAHGHGEHAGRYHHVARAFTQAGFVFLAFDLRGHGHSGGPRGHAPSYAQVLDDLGRILRMSPARPCLAYGHSMGGQFVLNRVLTDPAGIDAVIVTSPWLRLAFPAPAFKILLGRALYGILPSKGVATGLEQAALSHDPAVVAAYAADPLVHDQLSFRLGIDLLDGGERALARAEAFRLPVLMMHGSADRLIDPQATQLFHQRASSPDKTLHLWPGLFHETHNELEWEKVVAVSTGWARAHAG